MQKCRGEYEICRWWNVTTQYDTQKHITLNWILRICVVQSLQDFPCENNIPKERHLHVTASNFTSLTWVLLSALRKGRNTLPLTSPPKKQKYQHQNEYCWFLGCEAVSGTHLPTFRKNVLPPGKQNKSVFHANIKINAWRGAKWFNED
jgi:hypothetical protein